MSEDNDFWDTDSRKRGQSSLAFMGWLICLPYDLCASFRRGTARDPIREDSDSYGAIEGGQSFHYGDGI